ncbi:MAG: class I SAM-dependent methyltransferase [Acidimicrobiia bacterium]
MSVSDAWEAHAQDWIAWARTSQHDGFWSGTWPALHELLPAPGGVAVDLGCGEGRAGRELIALGHDVVGVERSPTLAEAARAAEPAFPVALGDAAALPMRAGSVSLVVASCSLQDVDDLESSLHEVARVLRPDGALCAAIVHPFSSASDEEAAVAGRFEVNQPYLEARRYEMAIDRGGLTMRFVSMHWPLSTYVNLLAREDLVITALREAGDDEVPWLLAFRAERRG